MDEAYRLSSRVGTGLFILITAYTVPSKVAQERRVVVWLHSLLHLGSALVGAYAGWPSPSLLPAKAFTWGIGIVYFPPRVYG